MRVWAGILAGVAVGNVAFAGLHIWEHDVELALISLGAAGFCLVGFISNLRSGDY